MQHGFPDAWRGACCDLVTPSAPGLRLFPREQNRVDRSSNGGVASGVTSLLRAIPLIRLASRATPLIPTRLAALGDLAFSRGGMEQVPLPCSQQARWTWIPALAALGRDDRGA